MNHEDGTDPWVSQRPETPLWDAAEYSQLISAGPLLPLLVQYVGIGMMHDNKKRTFAMFVTMNIAFYLCPTMSFSQILMTKTHSGGTWQVQSQGANTDKCTGNQLQLANVANQGNAYEKETYW